MITNQKLSMILKGEHDVEAGDDVEDDVEDDDGD